MQTTTLSIRRRKELASLGRRKGRTVLGQMLLEGTRSVQAAVDAGVDLVDIVLSSDRADLAAWAGAIGAPVTTASPATLAMISNVRTSQGIVAAVRCPELVDLDSCERILVLDGVQDPGNVGTLIRSAAWFGIDGVLAGPGTADFFSTKTVRATMGAIWDVRLGRSDDLVQTLLGMDHAIWMADLTGVAMNEWQPERRTALILASEAHGPSDAVAACATGRVTIKPRGTPRATESLNVASAGAILMAQWSAAC